jgi:hypothetical protein
MQGVDAAWDYLEKKGQKMWWRLVGGRFDIAFLAFAGGFFAGIIFAIYLMEQYQTYH